MIATISPAMIDCIRDGVVIPVVQRLKDGHFPVGPEFYDPQPSYHGQQHHLSSIGPVHDDPASPGELPKSGLASIGPDPAQASSYGNFCPGGLCLHAPSPGKPTLSFHQMMLRCTDMMELLIQQQHQLQQALSTMAAAPLCSIQPKPTQKNQQLECEVTSSALCCPATYKPALINEPRSYLPVCHNSSVLAVNVESSRAHSGISTSQQNRDHSRGETNSDVTSDDHQPQKHANVGKPLSLTDEVASVDPQFQPEPANPFPCQITEASTSTTAQNDTSADVIDQHREQLIRTVSHAAHSADQKELDRLKQVNIIPAGSGGPVFFAMCQQKFSSPMGKVVASANGSLELHIFVTRLHQKQGISVSYLGQLPPWPPPVCTLNILVHMFNKIRGGRTAMEEALDIFLMTNRCAPEHKSSSKIKFERTSLVLLHPLTVRDREPSRKDDQRSFSSQDLFYAHVHAGNQLQLQSRSDGGPAALPTAKPEALPLDILLDESSSVPELPPLNPMQLAPRSLTPEPVAQSEMPPCASSTSWIAPTSEPTIIPQPVPPLRRSDRNRRAPA